MLGGFSSHPEGTKSKEGGLSTSRRALLALGRMGEQKQKSKSRGAVEGQEQCVLAQHATGRAGAGSRGVLCWGLAGVGVFGGLSWGPAPRSSAVTRARGGGEGNGAGGVSCRAPAPSVLPQMSPSRVGSRDPVQPKQPTAGRVTPALMQSRPRQDDERQHVPIASVWQIKELGPGGTKTCVAGV